ncbi:anaerobic ribonucleotide reductase-activating protein [Marinomonas gallaica]|uniref:Anaerobic ribonucleotide reductase-activating protein n=2 Tax=Marinomonas gallaica TaxID=1806667 RepID=A0A1C3JTZ3_9GAMM|nr:anaerobic ribonucleotide reductase-activating protein [Marinomonas gallaica]SBT22752.1 anaerobic ribonucleotide reductase-activating protein [Marinomonas gallaica]
MWSEKPKKLLHREVLLEAILATEGIQGVTLLGGEPLEQQINLVWLLGNIREKSDLTIFVFTGYEVDEIERLGAYDDLQKLCDMIAIGRYRQSYRNVDQQWIGSSNQTVMYPNGSREKEQSQKMNQVEIIIDDNASLSITGFPDDDLVKTLMD